MATAIRLSRGGSKKRPYYRIVVADSRSPRDGKFIERIGSYNPLLAKDDEKRVVLDAERAKYWVEMGAQPTDRVARFLDAAGVKERPSRNNPQKAEPGEKAKERAEEKAAKLAEAEEAGKVLADEAVVAPIAEESAPAEVAEEAAAVETTPPEEATAPEEVAAAEEVSEDQTATAAEDAPAAESETGDQKAEG